mgnify:CR=1 FL=1
MDYKATLNMPKSGFPMRAGLPKREPEMLKHWEEMDLYNVMLKKNEGKPRFALHDGPPFSNGGLHMGHALNKSLKDFITRSYAMRGYYTPYIPGWDNHGMPIESAIIKQNKLNHKAMPVSEFRSACHEFAQHYIDVQMEGFKRIGVLGDWEHPYKTMDPGFEAEEVKVFGEMYKKGYIYKGLKPVYWCYHDETALAEAEIEYQDDPCTTVYVKFPMNDDLGKLSHLDKSKLNFVIWTTTIWTLPGNLAIALHPDESYAIVKNEDNGEMYIVAEALVEKVMTVGNVEHYSILETHPGNFYENMLAQHPFLPKTSRLVLADYVTMDSGTGCVHTAPGFGVDDYHTGMKYGMEILVPVDDKGRQTADAGKFAGMDYESSNAAILDDLRRSGALLASEIEIGRIVMPSGVLESDASPAVREALELANERGVSIETASAGAKIVSGGFAFDVLSPQDGMEGDNERSLVLYTQSMGARILTTGDLPAKSEMESPPDCDILKVAHHGSKYATSDEFLRQTTPKIALISVGANNRYGHPTARVLEALDAVGASVYRTDESGYITLWLSEGRITAQTYRRAPSSNPLPAAYTP